jgi:hypothetical protein
VDEEYNNVRKVDIAGIITTIAGNGFPGYYGDYGNPLLAELDNPEGVAVDNAGVYISDNDYSVIRLITMHPLNTINTSGIQQGITVFPNPSTGVFSLLISSTINEQALITITNVFGEKIKEFSTTTNLTTREQLCVPAGIYFLSATTGGKEYKEKIIIQ